MVTWLVADIVCCHILTHCPTKLQWAVRHTGWPCFRFNIQTKTHIKVRGAQIWCEPNCSWIGASCIWGKMTLVVDDMVCCQILTYCPTELQWAVSHNGWHCFHFNTPTKTHIRVRRASIWLEPNNCSWIGVCWILHIINWVLADDQVSQECCHIHENLLYQASSVNCGLRWAVLVLFPPQHTCF